MNHQNNVTPTDFDNNCRSICNREGQDKIQKGEISKGNEIVEENITVDVKMKVKLERKISGFIGA